MSTTPKQDVINPYCKRGDKVLVKKDLEPNTRYGGAGFSSSMKKYMGQFVTITERGGEAGAKTKYKIAEDGGGNLWSDAMFDY